MHKVIIKEQKHTFMDEVKKALDDGFQIVGIEVETIGSGRYIVHALNENDDSVAYLEEQHPSKTADELEAFYADEVGSYLAFEQAVKAAFAEVEVDGDEEKTDCATDSGD